MKQIFKSKRNILIMMFALVVIMGIGFAAYSQQLRINDTSSIDSNWNIYIKEVSVPSKTSGATGSGTVDEVEKLKAELTTDLKYPGDYVIYNITVANDGTIDAILEKINFSMEKEDTVINYYYSVDDQTTWNKVTKNGENPYNEDLLANTTDEFQVKVEYDPTKTGTATKEQKSNKLTLNLDYAQKTGGEVVPSNTVSFGGQTVTLAEVETDGLYADEYEEGRYIYKGANPNNYITFNDETAGWRILSVENDGTLKLMKRDSIGKRAWDTTGGTDGSNNWARPADLNTFLNNEIEESESYYKSLSLDSKELIQAHNFSIGGAAYNNSDLAAQIQSENGIIWNGKIGLITASEFLRSNYDKNKCETLALYNKNSKICKTTNYIILNTSVSLWTISSISTTSSNIFYLYYGGAVGNYKANNTTVGINPVLYLKSDITLSGTGTQSDPYTINS